MNNKFGIWSAIKTLWKIGNNKDRICFIFLLFAGAIRAITELIIPLVTACILLKLSGEPAQILGFYFPESLSVPALITICLVILFSSYFVATIARALIRLFSCSMKTKMNVYAMKLLLEARKNCDFKMTRGEAGYIVKSSSEYVASFIENGIIKIICPVVMTIIAIVYITALSPLSLIVLIITIALMVFFGICPCSL